ncbi:MAG TPA: hypothetical protein VF522_06285 [Ramlibacter sp.]|uniref:hypothetical protein n=1 Tax=Ramlibacter sp. TaxID=1917967 RepID=UPI002ED43915
MTSIDPRRGIDALLRDQLGRLRERGRATKSGDIHARSQDAQANELLSTRLAALDPADPDRKQKAVLLFLESELAREFGPAILNDPAFSGMLDAIHGQMRADAQVGQAMESLGDWLVSGKLP